MTAATETTQDQVLRLDAERRTLYERQEVIQEELESLGVINCNGWYRCEDRIEPAIIRPTNGREYPAGEPYRDWDVLALPDGSGKPYLKTMVIEKQWVTTAAGVGERLRGREELYEAVYKTEAAAIEGAIAYCAHKEQEWRQKRAALEARERHNG